MSAAYVLSAIGTAIVLFYAPMLWAWRRSHREAERPLNVITFPRRDAKVYELPRRGGAA